MLVKLFIFFLVAMVVIALVGRVLFPSALPRVMRKRSAPLRCRNCGRPLIGQKPCDCGGKSK